MIITIDRAGRLVIPKRHRDQLNLGAGTALEIEAAADGLTLRRAGVETALVRKDGILIHHGSVPSAIDVAEFIRAERHVRAAHTGGSVD